MLEVNRTLNNPQVTEAITKGLNPPQREAVECMDGPLLILAGAGSGKTRVLTHRAAHLVATGRATVEQILCVTFTNKAAREMEARIQTLLAQLGLQLSSQRQRMWISTFHSIGARVLREHIELLDYKPFFVIYDSADQMAMVKKVCVALGIDDKVTPAKTFAARINAVKTEGYTPTDIDKKPHLMDEQQLRVFTRYEEEMKQANALDFNDLLIKWYQLWRDYPALLDVYRERFRYVMVDEYQDTNAIQYKLVRLLADGHKNLCVVGDEDQSIYSWRGADIQNILSFEKDFVDARIVKLEQNYRSTQVIVEAASTVIKNNSQRKDKTLFTERERGELILIREENNEYDEARFVVGEIAKLLSSTGASPEEVAVFYRTNAQSRVLEEQLRARSIPYKIVGGMKFFDRMEVKDILGYLKLILNPSDDVAFKRVLNVPARGLGKTTADRLDEIAAGVRLPLIEVTSRALDVREFNAGTTSKLRGFLSIIEGLREEAMRLSLPDLTSLVIERTGYVQKLVAENTPEADARIQNLEELQNAVTQFAEERGEEGHLQAFLEEMALVADADDAGQSEDAQARTITLMTLHISKGLEFPYVFIVGCEEGLFPSGRATDSKDPTDLEEERRLCYVGMTRAEKRLVMTHARARKVWGADQMNPPSRFLREIPNSHATRQSSSGQRPRFMSQEERGFGDTYSPHPLMASGSSADPFPDYEGGDSFDDTGTPSPATLTKGMRVRHPSHGLGQIDKVEGVGPDMRVWVVFADKSMKKFVARYARLERA